MNPPTYTPTPGGSMVPTTPGTLPATPTPGARRAYPGMKRGRKPKDYTPTSGSSTPRMASADFKVPATPTPQATSTQWPTVAGIAAQPTGTSYAGASTAAGTSAGTAAAGAAGATAASNYGFPLTPGTPSAAATAALQTRLQQLSLPGVDFAQTPTRPFVPSATALGGEDEAEEDELLPAMADDDYSAQLSWQSQSKDNLKVLMDNFTDTQYDRFEAYRRQGLPKAAVRKVIQQTLGQQVSQPVAQVVAGFSKVFVGEIVEKARAVQERRGESGPLSPDHLREAYRAYQQETGRVGAARPLRSKRLFVR